MARGSSKTPLEPPIARRSSPPSPGLRALPSVVWLAWWRLRSSPGLLLMAGLGMFCAVMLVSCGPLYSSLAMSAGLRSVLSSSAENQSILVQAQSYQIGRVVFNTIDQRISQDLQSYLGPYTTPIHLSIVVPLQLVTIRNNQRLQPPIDDLRLVTQPLGQAATHLSVLQGRLPTASSNGEVHWQGAKASADLEIALSQEEAQHWHIAIGDTLGLLLHYDLPGLPPRTTTPYDQTLILTLHVSAIFANEDQHASLDQDPFWNGETFQSVDHQGFGLQGEGADYTALADTQSLMAILDSVYQQVSQEQLPLQLNIPLQLYWLSELVIPHITADRLPALLAGVQGLQITIANHAADNAQEAVAQTPFVENTSALLSSDTLSLYESRLSIAQIPITCMLVLIAALMLFFVSMIADLLVDRESETIALLRSRGISRPQILGMFATQGLVLAALAMLGGTFGAVYLTRLLTRTLLPGGGQNVLDLITGNPLPLMWGMRWPALITALAGLLTLLIALLRPLRSDILSLRRETARASYRPFWRRFNLDIAALILMVGGIATSAYFINSNVLSARLQLLLLTPLTVLEAACLLMAAILLFLRVFPQLLRLATRLAARRRGAAPLLAVAQLARAPRQPLQMTLLLALATAFALFGLVFMASQEQRPADVAAYTGGADFSGPLATTQSGDELASLTTAYRHIPGVISASLGFSGTASAGSSLNVTIGLLAVDTRTFAQTSIWTAQDSDRSPQTLMAELQARSAWGKAHQMVPAIIDDAAAQSLHLSPGSTLVLKVVANSGESAITTTFVVLTQIHHIPSIIASARAAGSPQTSVFAGGVLVDFQTYAAVFAVSAEAAGVDLLPVNYVWLHTQDSPTALRSVRAALNSNDLGLTQIIDRRLLLVELSYEPLYLALFGVLLIGMAAVVLLALLGNLLASWWSVRRRLLQFALLRALGSSLRQVTTVLLWEQSLIYSAALLLGSLFGLVLAWLVTPALIFTGVPSGGSGSDIDTATFLISQSVPPVRLVFPPWLPGALGALLLLCLLALWLMATTVMRSLPGRLLRMSED